MHTYRRADRQSAVERGAGMALTLPAFNCVPERDPLGLDIRAGVMTREQEQRKKEQQEQQHVRYPRHASCTYVRARGRGTLLELRSGSIHRDVLTI